VPVAVNDSYAVARNTQLTIGSSTGVLVNDRDPDGTALKALIVSGPSGGSLRLAEDGSFVYTPRKNFSGTDTFTYRATDGTDGAIATVSISVSGGTTTTKNGRGNGADKHGALDVHNLPAPADAWQPGPVTPKIHEPASRWSAEFNNGAVQAAGVEVFDGQFNWKAASVLDGLFL
jgi:VCBS repeat-containing protein